MFRLIVPLLVAGLFMFQPAHAQTPTSCPIPVEEALTVLDNACSAVGSNQACYAADQVTAAFYGDVDETTFNEPADTVALTTLRALSTSPLNPETETWGMALMRVQALLPDTLPGQGVLFVMLGDVSVENSVTPDEAVVLTELVQATVIVRGANLRGGPSTNFNVVGSVANGATLGVNARNPAGDWLRVTYEGVPAWVFAELVSYPGDINALSVVSDTTFSPMQAFIMETGIGTSGCEDAPNSLLVQTPRDANIRLNVNGATVTVGSTVVFDTPTSDSVRLTVLDGEAQIEGVVRVPAGFTAQIPLGGDATFDAGEDGYNFGVTPITDELLDTYTLFETLPAMPWLHYPIVLPDDVADFPIFDDFAPEEFDGDFQGEPDASAAETEAGGGLDVDEFTDGNTSSGAGSGGSTGGGSSGGGSTGGDDSDNGDNDSDNDNDDDGSSDEED